MRFLGATKVPEESGLDFMLEVQMPMKREIAQIRREFKSEVHYQGFNLRNPRPSGMMQAERNILTLANLFPSPVIKRDTRKLPEGPILN